MSRLNLLRGAVVGADATALPALLSVCGERPGGNTNEVTVEPNASDAVPRRHR